MLRRISQLFSAPTLAQLLHRDLDEARRHLREATLNVEAWESREVLYRSRIERLERELKCATPSKSKVASLASGAREDSESRYAALFAGTNGLSYEDLNRAIGSSGCHVEAADLEKKPSSPEASSPPRASFLKSIGKKP